MTTEGGAGYLGHLNSRIAPRDARRAVIVAPSRRHLGAGVSRTSLQPRPRCARRDYLRASGGDLGYIPKGQAGAWVSGWVMEVGDAEGGAAVSSGRGSKRVEN